MGLFLVSDGVEDRLKECPPKHAFAGDEDVHGLVGGRQPEFLNQFRVGRHGQTVDHGTQNALVELSKLDGAFVLRGDGFIQTAGAFLATFDVEVKIPPGFGARHLAAAAVTKRTAATAIVVSSTDGHVRAFSGGNMVLQLDPNVPYDLITGGQ